MADDAKISAAAKGGKGLAMSFLWIGLSSYLLLVLGMYGFQRSLLYPAGRLMPAVAAMNLPELRAVTTVGKDGLEHTHWYLPAKDSSHPTVVVFHGNAGHLADRVPKFSFLAEAGFGVLFAGYRGYGGNPGKPSEPKLMEDAEVLLDWLIGEGVAAGRIVLYGESLGSGVSVQLAARRDVAALVLEAPFTAVAEVAQAHYWYVPAKWLILDKWNSLARVDRLTAPVLVLHGEQDRVTDVNFGRRLFEAIEAPKQGIFVPGAGHNDLYNFGVDDSVVSFIREAVPIPMLSAP